MKLQRFCTAKETINKTKREICCRRRSKVKTHKIKKNEEEIGNLPEKEFRVMIVKMIQNLGNRMEKIQETFTRT